MNDAEKIAENMIKSVATDEMVKAKFLWENQDCVITFFRRFGCSFCRLAAKELSEIKPQLDARNIRLIGVGVEEVGVEDFVEGKFFAGDLYIDMEKKCYKDLNYKRFGRLSLIPALFRKSSRDAIHESRASNLGADLKGDFYQVGGTLVVAKGGQKVLLSHKQQQLADHVNVKDVLKCFDIE